MPRPKEEPTKIAERQAKAAEMYVMGQTQAAIARELGVSRPTITVDLQAIRKQWRESAIRDFDVLKDVELAKLEKTEREAWDAWIRSQANAVKVKTTQEKGGDFDKVESWSEQQVGDPRFLAVVQTCIQKRCAILGLDAPVKQAQTDTHGNDINTFSEAEAELDSVISALSARIGASPGPSSNGSYQGGIGDPGSN